MPQERDIWNSVFNERGVWVVYIHNPGPVAKSIHTDAYETLKYMEWGDLVSWWPANLTIEEAIEKWQKRFEPVPEAKEDV